MRDGINRHIPQRDDLKDQVFILFAEAIAFVICDVLVDGIYGEV